QEARERLGSPMMLPGPVGESNVLTLHGRGVFACISPWNFPVAIFTGQVAAALVAGNTVVAKPAQQTALTAYRVAELILKAGIPPGAFHLLPGDGAIGRALVADPRIAGVAFTGSTATARAIQRVLAEREGPIVPLIAESGPVPPAGTYVAPVAFEIGSIREVPGERFGPILHIARFPLEDLDRIVDDINATGYGLTMGVHTRMDSRAERIRERSAVG